MKKQNASRWIVETLHENGQAATSLVHYLDQRNSSEDQEQHSSDVRYRLHRGVERVISEFVLFSPAEHPLLSRNCAHKIRAT